MENHPAIHGKFNYKWQSSMAILYYNRVNKNNNSYVEYAEGNPIALILMKYPHIWSPYITMISPSSRCYIGISHEISPGNSNQPLRFPPTDASGIVINHGACRCLRRERRSPEEKPGQTGAIGLCTQDIPRWMAMDGNGSLLPSGFIMAGKSTIYFDDFCGKNTSVF